MRKWMIAVAAMVAVGFVACGGSDDDNGNDDGGLTGGGSGGDGGTGGTGGTGGAGGAGGSGGTGGTGGTTTENPCMIDPTGEACLACTLAIAECVGSTCATEYEEFEICDAACSPEDDLCCSDEALAVYDCVVVKCPDASPCFAF